MPSKSKFDYNKAISCCICKTKFKSGDTIQAFLRSPDNPVGSWTPPTKIGLVFFLNTKKNTDCINRKHERCKP